MSVSNKSVIDVTKVNIKSPEYDEHLKAYLKEVRKHTLLTREEEIELFKRYENGDTSVVSRIVEANMRFVFAVAKRYANQSNILDLVEEGNEGMIEAITKFNWRLGNRFLSYAVWYIRKNISIHIFETSFIKKTNSRRIEPLVNKITNEFYLTNGYLPSDEYVSEILEKKYDIPLKDNSYIYPVETISIDTKINQEDTSTFADSVIFTSQTSSQNEIVDISNREYNKKVVERVLAILPEREQKIMKYLYGIGDGEEHTMDDAAELFGMTKERIRQIKNACLKKMYNKASRLVSSNAV